MPSFFKTINLWAQCGERFGSFGSGDLAPCLSILLVGFSRLVSPMEDLEGLAGIRRTKGGSNDTEPAYVVARTSQSSGATRQKKKGLNIARAFGQTRKHTRARVRVEPLMCVFSTPCAVPNLCVCKNSAGSAACSLSARSSFSPFAVGVGPTAKYQRAHDTRRRC